MEEPPYLRLDNLWGHLEYSPATVPKMPEKPEIIDLYFMNARSKLIDIAAFMDRIE